MKRFVIGIVSVSFLAASVAGLSRRATIGFHRIGGARGRARLVYRRHR